MYKLQLYNYNKSKPSSTLGCKHKAAKWIMRRSIDLIMLEWNKKLKKMSESGNCISGCIENVEIKQSVVQSKFSIIKAKLDVAPVFCLSNVNVELCPNVPVKWGLVSFSTR